MNKNNLKKLAKRIVVIGLVVMSISLFACKNNNNDKYVTFDENLPVSELIKQKEEVYKKLNDEITISAEEAARGKTVENTKRTVNEYGITIYGRKIDKTEPIYSKIEDKDPQGFAYTYTEYYSDAYGGKVYIKSNDKSGGIVIYNESGEKIMAGSKKVAHTDLETIMANYRMGNAMTEAIDKTYKK